MPFSSRKTEPAIGYVQPDRACAEGFSDQDKWRLANSASSPFMAHGFWGLRGQSEPIQGAPKTLERDLVSPSFQVDPVPYIG